MAFRGRASGGGGGKDWNPMEAAYNDGSFNSYKEGPGVGHQPNSNRNSKENSQTVKLFVGNVDKNMTQEGLENVFSACGVKPVSVFKKEETDKPTTFGFIEYSNHSDAENAIRVINRQGPHNLTVRYRQTEEEKKRKGEEGARQAMPPASYSTYQNNRARPLMPLIPDQSGGMNMVNGARQAGFGRRDSRNSAPNDPTDVACEPLRDGFYDPNSAGDFEDVDRAVMAVVDADNVNNISIRAGTAGRKVSFGRGYYAPSATNGPATRISSSSPRANKFPPIGEPEAEVPSRNLSTSSSANVPPLPVPVCQRCMKPAEKVCSLCKLARYCSNICAVEHWPAHMFHCIATIPPPGICAPDERAAPYLSRTTGSTSQNDNSYANRSQNRNNSSAVNNSTTSFTRMGNATGNNNSGAGEVPITPNIAGNLSQRFAPVQSGNRSANNNVSANNNNASANNNNASANNNNASNKTATDASFGSPLTASTPRVEPVTAGGEWEKTEELPPDVYSQVTVSASLSNCLWVQQEVNFVKICNLVNELTKAGPTLAPAEPSLGHLFAGKFLDEWHRVKVVAVQPKLRVLYIDYGNEEEMAAGGLRTLPEAYTKMRALAVRVKLINGTPDRYRTHPYESKMTVKPMVKNADGSVEVDVRYSLPANTTPQAQKPEPAAQQQVGAKQTQELPSGKYTEVIALSPLEPGNKLFMVSMKSMSSELEKQVNHLSSIGSSLPTCGNVHVGDIVAAEYLEGGWYRAKVLSLTPITVLFIDFGNEQTIVLNQMRALPEEYLSLPGQAIQVIFAQGSTRTKVNEEDSLLVKPVSKTPEGWVIVELSAASEEVVFPLVGSPLVGSPLMASPLVASPLVGSPLIAAPRSPVSSTSPLPAATGILLTTKDDLACNRYVDLPLNTYTEVAIRVTGSIDYYVNIFANGRQIDEQMSKMMADKRSFVACQPTLHSLVAASLDGKLYRGKVVSLVPLKVLCIDFGKVEVIQPAKMRALPREFTKLAAQAIKMSVGNGAASQHRNLPLDSRLKVKPVDKLSDGTTVVQVQEDEQKQQEPKPVSAVSPATASPPRATPSAPTFKMATIPPNVASSVTITVPGETEYRVQLTNNIDTVTDMIGSMYRECPTLPAVVNPRIGDMVAAKLESIWYRLRVIEVKESAVVGCFVDYGFKDSVEIEDIRALQPEFTTLPLQGINIKLQAGTPRKYYNLAEDAVIMVKPVDMTPSGCVIVSVEEPPTHDEDNITSHPCDKSIVLPSDDFTEVMFVVKENDELWIQEIPPLGLATLMKNFNSNKLNLVRCVARVGAMVALLYEGDWSRAKVIATEPKIEVQFIDFGNRSFVTADELRALPEDMLSIPAQAVRVKLDSRTPESIALLPTFDTPFFVKPTSVAADGSIVVLGRE